MTIIFTDSAPDADVKFIEEADNALSNFLKLDKQERLKLSDLVFKNYADFLEVMDDDYKLKINKNEDIWDLIHPIEIYINGRPYNDKDMYVQIHCNWGMNMDFN